METKAAFAVAIVFAGLVASACGDDSSATDGGDECALGTSDCACRAGGVCDAGLVCRSDRCVPDGPAVGEEGGPCYSDGTCDAGLVCSAETICERPADADADADDDGGGGDVPVEDEASEAIDEGGDSGCDPIPGWPPDPATDPWYAGRDCLLPACDEGVALPCYDASGTWTQTLTTIRHTCGAMAEAFDARLRPGHVTTTTGVTFTTVGECEYDAEGTLVGVVHGATGISCSVSTEPDGMGGTITVLETGTATVSGPTMTGTARAFLFDLPMGTPDCYADYDLRFDRE